MTAAKRAWDAKMAAPPDTSSLDQYFAEAARYVAPVRPCVECGGKRHLEWDRFTVAGLKAAACGCRGTAAGPTDYDADFLLSMPTPAWQHLADLADMIMGTGIWPDALRAQNVTFIPKISSQDLRPIAVIPVVTRTLSRCLVQHCRFWTTRVQSTDAVGQLLRFEAAVTARIANNLPTVARTSDLASCFNHIDPSLAERAAVLHGMPDTHAHFLFSVNVDKPTILRGGEYAMRAPPPDSGLAQGDPSSPLGAAVVAATHKAILKSTVDGLQYFDTYVDDRTALTNSLEADRHDTQEVARLDRLMGQREDPKKGSMAAVFLTNGTDRADSILPLPLPLTNSRADNHIDTDIEVLGIVFDLTGSRNPRSGPRTERRAGELQERLRRIARIAKAAGLGARRRMAMMRAIMSLWRWDAPWVMADDTDLHSMRYDIEKTITGRQRHWAWRHGGAFWLTTDKGWLVEPFAVQFSVLIQCLVEAACSEDTARTMERVWAHLHEQEQHGAPCHTTLCEWLNEHAGADHDRFAVAQRCVIAAEPNAVRFSHLHPDCFSRTCPTCQAERSAFMLHGWHDHHRPQLCTLAYRVLNYKLAVFQPWHAAWAAADNLVRRLTRELAAARQTIDSLKEQLVGAADGEAEAEAARREAIARPALLARVRGGRESRGQRKQRNVAWHAQRCPEAVLGGLGHVRCSGAMAGPFLPQGYGERSEQDREEAERTVPLTALNSAARPYAPEGSIQALGGRVAEFGAVEGKTFFEEGPDADGNCSAFMGKGAEQLQQGGCFVNAGAVDYPTGGDSVDGTMEDFVEKGGEHFLQGGGLVQEGEFGNQEGGDSADGVMEDLDELRRLLLDARARVDTAALAVVKAGDAGADASQDQLELEAEADHMVEIEDRLANAKPVEPKADACRGRPPPGPWATGFVHGGFEENLAATAVLATAAGQRFADLTALFAASEAEINGSGGGETIPALAETVASAGREQDLSDVVPDPYLDADQAEQLRYTKFMIDGLPGEKHAVIIPDTISLTHQLFSDVCDAIQKDMPTMLISGVSSMRHPAAMTTPEIRHSPAFAGVVAGAEGSLGGPAASGGSVADLLRRAAGGLGLQDAGEPVQDRARRLGPKPPQRAGAGGPREP
ncbi:unnamed protein product [Prorocentrum cordatum]|uniref:Reverse transcriptase domain-containing protein n=1 Tax=Prorocentrum cordatum TaxID=2364126 RepID=A0ABN9S0R6_9DINO|nr:unnamed protein product [Polarella glacialis]